MLRYQEPHLQESGFGGSRHVEGEGAGGGAAAVGTGGVHEDFEGIVASLREGTIGSDQSFLSSVSSRHDPDPGANHSRNIVYCDNTASGRPLRLIEDYIRDNVLPFYGNTHTLSTATSEQSTHYRNEARSIIRNYFNCSHEDAVVFAGSGATGAVEKFLGILTKSGGFAKVEGGSVMEWFREDRWHSCECALCGVRVKNESAYRAHCFSAMHQKKLSLQNPKEQAGGEGAQGGSSRRRIVIVIDSAGHHSSTLPFRELCAQFPIKKGGSAVFDTSTHRISKDAPAISSDPSAPWEMMEVETLELSPDPSLVLEADEVEVGGIGGGAVHGLAEALEAISSFRASSASNGSVVPVCVLSAVSNVTGIAPDVAAANELIHRHGGIACWDLAALAGHLRFDMNPAGNPSAAPDFAFASPHKLLGGPGCPGLLLAKRSWMLNPVPSVPGGGVVFYVSDKSHSYIQSGEEREEAGTPDIVGCIRSGMVYLVHSWLDPVKLEAAESSMAYRLARAWGKHPNIDILGGERGWRVGSDGEGGGVGGGGRGGGGIAGGVGRGGKRVGIISFCVRYGNNTNGGTGLYLHHNFVCRVLNDVWGIQARGGCACAGPYAQHLLGMDGLLSDRFSACLERSGQEILRPGFARVGVHFTMSAYELEVLEKAVLWVADHGWRLLAAYTFQVETGEWRHRLEAQNMHRRWLSSIAPPSRTTPLPADIGKAEKDGASRNSMPVTADELRGAADRIVSNVHSTQTMPISSIKASNLDPDWSDLVWTALPADALKSFRSASERARTAGGNSKMDAVIWDAVPEACSGEDLFLARESGRGGGGTRICDSPFTVLGSGRDPRSVAEAAREEMGGDGGRCGASDGVAEGEEEVKQSGANDSKDHKGKSSAKQVLRPKVPAKMFNAVREACSEFNMVREGDKILVGLSGGKDSLTLLHCMLDIQRRCPFKIEVAAATVDPQTPEYDPSPLIPYLASLGVSYHVLSKPIITMAKEKMDPKRPSICSFCSRMKRGMLYSCMRENGYTALALGQHLDDIAESFLMSVFHNGALRTMKACYNVAEGDLRVIRPLVLLRESVTSKFALDSGLPIIGDNCPACFSAPKERHRVKIVLSEQEFAFPTLFSSLLSSLRPLLAVTHADRHSDVFTKKGAAHIQDDWDRAVQKREEQRASAGKKKPPPETGMESNKKSGGATRCDTRDGRGLEEGVGGGEGWWDEEEAEEMLLACNIGGKNCC